MIPRLSIAGTACLAFLSGFEQILCFAAAAPAPRIEARPKHYFPKHVKRIVTNGTQSHSQSQTSTTDLEAEKSSLQSEESTHTPTRTLNHRSSRSLSLPLESLLTSLLPIPFTQSPSVSSVSHSSADSSSRASFSVDPNTVSLSITPPGIVDSTNNPSSTQPLLSSAVSSSSAPVSTASVPKSSGTQSFSSGSEASLIQTLSGRSSSQSFAEPVSISLAPVSSQTSFASAAGLVGKIGTGSSIIKPSEEASRASAPSASISSGLGASSSAPTTTLSSPKTDATQLSASVTAPPKTVSISPGTPSPSQSQFGDFSLTKSTATDRTINGFIDEEGNETTSSRTEPADDDIVSQSRPVTSSRSGIATRSATESIRGGPPAAIPTTSSTHSILGSNSSTESEPKEDKNTLDIGISESATEVSIALFGANTVFFSTSKPTLSSSGISSPVSPTESATRRRNSITTKSGGADITASESSPRNTNIPEPSEVVHSTFNVSESAGVRTSATLSSVTPEKTTSVESISVEPERSASITPGFHGPASGIFPGEAKTSKRPHRPDQPDRPDVEVPGFDDLVTLESTPSARVPASTTIKTSQLSRSELSRSGTISTQATASVGTSTAGETRAVKRSSEFVFGSGGSFTIGATAPTVAPLQRTTPTASVLQSGDGASDSIGDSASPRGSKSQGLNGFVSSDIVAARPTITTSDGVVLPIPLITSGQAKPANPSTSAVPNPDLSDSALVDTDSSTRLVVPEKPITAGSSGSLVSEPNISASGVLKTSVSVSQITSEQSNTPSATLSGQPRSTLAVLEPAKPSKSGPDTLAQESNRSGAELPEGTTATLITTGLSFSKTSNIDAPEATKPSASQSSGLRSASSGSVINSEKESSTGASNGASSAGQPETKTLLTEAVPKPTNSIPQASTLTAETDGSPIVAASVSIKPSLTIQTNSIPQASTLTAETDGSPIVAASVSIKPSLTIQTDSVPQASASTTDRDSSPVPLTLAVDISPSIKPSSALQSDADAEKPSETPSLISSTTRPQPQISAVPSVTDLPQFVETSSTGEVGLSSGKTARISDGSPTLIPGVTNSLSSVDSSVLTQTDSSTPKETQQSDSRQTSVPGSTDVSLSTEASRAAQTATPTVKAPQINGESIATDLPPLTENSPGIQTASSADKASLPAKESSRGAQTDLVSEKSASSSGVPGGLSIPGPSATDSSPPTESSARPSFSASASETVGGGQPTNTLPISIPPKTGAATATEDTSSIVIPPTSSLPSVPPPESVPASRTDNTSPPTAAIPVVTTGSVSKDILAEPSKPITISNNQATSDKLTATSSAGSQAGLPVVIPTSASPPVPSSGQVAPPSSGTREVVPITVSPPVGLSAAEPAKSITSLPPVISPQPSETPITSLPIPIDQSTVTAPATSKSSEIPASTNRVPPVISPQPSQSSIAPPIPIDQSTVTAPATSKSSEIPASTSRVPPVISPQPSQSSIAPPIPIDQSTVTALSTSKSPEIPASTSRVSPVISPQPSQSSISLPIPIDQSTVTAPSTSKSPEIPASTSRVPPVISPQPSQSSIAPLPIPIDQSTVTASTTSKGTEIPASTGPVPPVIVLPTSTLGSETSRSAASAPTSDQSSVKATPSDASVTLSAPILVGISNVLTASTSNSNVSGYSSGPRSSSTVSASGGGIIVASSGVSPSASGAPTGVVSSASATAGESVASNSAVTASHSTGPVKSAESGAPGSPAVSVTSAIQTSTGYAPSAAVSAASSIETSKPTQGSAATGSLGVATPVQTTAQSTETSGRSTTPGAQPNLVHSTGATGLISTAASETAARGTQPSSDVISALSSSVPNAPGSVKPGSTSSVFPPSAAASAPPSITPGKESPKTQVTIPSGSNVAVSTATDTLTAPLIGSSILAEPSASMPTATADFPSGIASSVPRIISPPNGVPEEPNNTTLCQIGFLYPLNYNFVLSHEQSQRQIFKYLPQGIADGLSIPLENVTMQTLRAYDTTQDLHYITTLALFFIPSQQMDLLSLDLHTPAHKIYNNTNPSVRTIMSMINPAIPLKGDNSLGTPSAPGSGKDDPSTSKNPDPGNEGVPISQVDNSSPVRAKSVGIAAGVVCGAAAYGAAMFFVARRYRKRKQSHRRSPSMLSSPVLSGTSPDYTVGAGTALMSGGRGDGDRSSTPHNGYYYERNSRGSGHSGSTGRQQISAPVMAENSLGWN